MILHEKTNGLTDKPLPYDKLLKTAFGWRMFELLCNPEAKLEPRFTVMSNVRGSGKSVDKLVHHIFGNHLDEYSDYLDELTLQQHTTIHNYIINSCIAILTGLFGTQLKSYYAEYCKAFLEQF